MPFYARGWHTESTDVYQVAPEGPGPEGTWDNVDQYITSPSATADYKDLKNYIDKDRNNWKLIFDKDAIAVMAHGRYVSNKFSNGGKKSLWTLDDERVICEKTNFALNQNLGGVFAWESSGDGGVLLDETNKAMLENGNRNCASVYPDSNYDIIFQNTKKEYAGLTSDCGGFSMADGESGDGNCADDSTDTNSNTNTQEELPQGISGSTNDDNLETSDKVYDRDALLADGKKLIDSIFTADQKNTIAQAYFDRSVMDADWTIEKALAQPNVARVARVVTEQVFHQIFPIAHRAYSYENFLRSIHAFPKLCGEDGQTDEGCLRGNSCYFW